MLTLKLLSYHIVEGRRKSGRAEKGGNEAKENRSPDNRRFCWRSLSLVSRSAIER